MSAANPAQRVYRADLHSHTWDSSDSLANPDEIVAVACRRGVDMLAITDHNVLRTALKLRDRYPELIVAGEEIKTTEGEIIGLFLEREIPRGLTPEETIARIRDQGGHRHRAPSARPAARLALAGAGAPSRGAPGGRD